MQNVCPFCDVLVDVRADGKLAIHANKSGKPCDGSGKTWREAHNEHRPLAERRHIDNAQYVQAQRLSGASAEVQNLFTEVLDRLSALEASRGDVPPHTHIELLKLDPEELRVALRELLKKADDDDEDS